MGGGSKFNGIALMLYLVGSSSLINLVGGTKSKEGPSSRNSTDVDENSAVVEATVQDSDRADFTECNITGSGPTVEF